MRRKGQTTAIVLVRQEQVGIDLLSSIHELVPSEAIQEQREVIVGCLILQRQQAGELLGELLAHNIDFRVGHVAIWTCDIIRVENFRWALLGGQWGGLGGSLGPLPNF